MTGSDERDGIVVDEGTTGELVQDKMSTEAMLRGAAADDGSNPNDQPGFQDGMLGGSDFEDRQGTPNNDGDSDLGGDAHGGAGVHRAGGVDGGPARTTPLPGSNAKK
ncbi:hypothetical protein HNQ07_004459 [Deinococcus metalli]|uniref:Uncharacterized protein n=1 Tax=Deinococcus metalli TaxID=1141878 RepID=A0A7W8NU51_9DEIO|nr:hypothetical protein [Deinococcus metalli]MBB5378952.1 hypothetical protein [Deinococcus metalli]GHF62971.1 hypothetical protein GCM10017781_43790 [Deinococcus metalli]